MRRSQTTQEWEQIYRPCTTQSVQSYFQHITFLFQRSTLYRLQADRIPTIQATDCQKCFKLGAQQVLKFRGNDDCLCSPPSEKTFAPKNTNRFPPPSVILRTYAPLEGDDNGRQSGWASSHKPDDSKFVNGNARKIAALEKKCGHLSFEK